MSELLALISTTDLLPIVLDVARALDLIAPTLTVLALIAAFLWVFAVLYIAAMGVYRLHLGGLLKERTEGRWVTRWLICYPLVAVAYVVDVVAQYTVATAFFLDWPPAGERLVTDRLQRYLERERPTSRRWEWAHIICTELDLFDPTGDHCNRRSPA